jgi:2,4-dienoyl-CoA reductase-like NADH-dependent reductase (Old Yellow Enzyme family)/thioredoxin reductase
MSADPLLQPFRLKHLTLKNRIMTTSHEPAYPEDGMPKARYRLYHAERAKGGVALTMTAGSAVVSRDSPPVFNNILAYRDEVVPWMRELADACHEHGAAVMIQLTHLGRRTVWNTGDWLPVLAPSRVREAAHRAFPKEAEDWDLERIAGDYADAAERMVAAGLDGIEIEAYGHLLDQFWSPVTNRRADEHGGALENRLAFTFRVLDAIRARVGAEFIVGIRLVADEQLEGGIDAEEGREIARRMVARGQVDFLNVIRGHIDTDPALANVIPLQGMRSAPHLDFAGEIRAATQFPVFHAARIPDVATARHAVASGKLDMVGMTRAHIAEPHIVRKIMEGREAEIRPCVGATYCLDRIYTGGEALCIHNPATGREAAMPHVIATRADRRLKVVVVGAGPAGLEAARVAGQRGHAVVVLEAADAPGGQVRLTALAPGRAEMIGIVDWRMEECERAGVAFRFNTYAEAEDVLAETPEVVIVATGGLPAPAPLARGAELVTGAWDILAGDVKPGAEVIVCDEGAGPSAMLAAEKVAAAGGRLAFVTPERAIAPDIGGLNLVPHVRRLQAAGAEFALCWRLASVERSGNRLKARFVSDYGDAVMEREADQVVADHGLAPLTEVYEVLRPLSSNGGAVDYAALLAGRPQGIVRNADGAFRLFRIGDAVAPRNTHAAIYDALRLLKDL